MDALQEIRFTLRGLWRRPSLAVTACLCLGLAIAGNLVVFALINGLVFRATPFTDPDRLFFVGELAHGAVPPSVSSISTPNFADWRERQDVFEDLVPFRQRAFGLPEGESVRPVRGAAVGPGFFRTLGIEPRAGRLFRAEEATPGLDRVAVVTPSFFRRVFGEEPTDLTGATLALADGPYDVIGVLPENFEWFGATPEIWVPFALDSASLDDPVARARRDVFSVGRLREGVTPRRAHIRLEEIASRLEKEHPATNEGWGAHLVSLRHDVPSPRNRQAIFFVQMALLVVMSIACVDVASLVIVRERARARELAVRAALGAGRRRLMRERIVESLVIAGLAATLGLGLAAFALRFLRPFLDGRLSRFHQPFLDVRVFAACVGLGLLAAVVFGLAPTLQARRLQPIEALRSGGRGTIGRGRRTLPGLVVAQMALSMALLGGAGLLIQGYLDLQNQAPGFETDGLVVYSVGLPTTTYPDAATRIQAADEILRRLAAAPGLESAAIANQWPRATRTAESPVVPADRTTMRESLAPRAVVVVATPDFFSLLDLEPRGGRLDDFAAARADSEPVVVVNRSLAERLWPGEEAVDRRLSIGGTSRRVLAVVGDVRHAFYGSAGRLDAAYLPWAQAPSADLHGVVRVTGDPRAAVGAIRAAVAEIDPRLVVADLQPLEAVGDRVFFSTRLFAGILSGFGLLALLLAALGTYGVLAHAVVLRTGEIGVRLALGARPRDVLGQVLVWGLRLAAIGIVLGLPLVWAAHRLALAVLAADVTLRPSLVPVAVLVLLATALIAALHPALRAARVEPVEALRHE